MILETFVYLSIGSLAGFLSGLFGIGGGFVVVPALLYMFSYFGASKADAMQMAVSTSLAAMIFTASSSAFSHSKKEGFDWRLVKEMAPGVVLGAVVGAFFASKLPSAYLKKIFAVFAVLFGVYFYWTANHFQKEGKIKKTASKLFLSGGFIGALSSILGLGGGVITVPVLIAFNTNVRTAISTSAATSFLIAISGALTYFLTAKLADRASVLNVQAALSIGVASFFLAPLGAHFAYKIPSSILKKIFGVFLVIAGVIMLKS